MIQGFGKQINEPLTVFWLSEVEELEFKTQPPISEAERDRLEARRPKAATKINR